MPIETEAKMKLEQGPDAVIDRLQQRGAVPVGRFFEINTFFDTEDRQLLAADRGLRLRVSRNDDTGQAHCVLTHKGPNRIGPLKSREETELVVESAQDAEALLGCLGLARTLSFQKRRESWRLGECRIEIDEVPLLGRFVEIEGPGEPAVMRVREALGLADRPLIRASYIAMLAAHLQELGDNRRDVSF